MADRHEGGVEPSPEDRLAANEPEAMHSQRESLAEGVKLDLTG